MTKDKQWLRDEVNTMYRQVVMGELTFDEQWILRHVFDLADQLDEPKPQLSGKEWLKEDLKKYANSLGLDTEKNVVGHVLYKIDQIEEPETLSQEWISKHLTDGHNVDAGDAVVFVDDLKNIVVTKPDKPVIPEFVADWYEREGKRSSWWNWFYKWGRDESRSDLETKTIKWMQDYNEEKFVDVFSHGYEVEKEKRYRVNVEGLAILASFYGEVGVYHNSVLDDEDYVKELTEQEIKEYDERFWPFAVPVEEVPQ